MKRIGLLLLFVWQAVAAFGQTDNYRDAADAALINLDRQFVTSRILYDRSFPIANLGEFSTTDISSATHFLQARSELYNAAYDPERQITPDDLERNIWRSKQQRIVPIGITLARFEKIVPELVELDPITNRYRPGTPGSQQRANGDVFTTNTIALASPLLTTLPLGTSTFSIPSWAVFNNTSSVTITSVQVDFGDGNPLKTMIVDGGIVQAIYGSSGEKTVRFTIHLSNGTQQTAAAQFSVTSAVAFDYPRNDGISDIDFLRLESTIAFEGYSGNIAPCPNGQGDVLSYYAAGPANQRILRKPIIFMDGFDPGDERSGEAIYGDRLVYSKNGQPTALGDELRKSGYDVIILNFPKYECGGQVRDGGADYVERNGMVLVTLINQINAKLRQNGSTEKLIVVGPSMGGLISRYALRYMELSGLNHNCKLWVSFDSPHHGANISIGLQYFLKSVQGIKPSAKAALRDKLDSPAARQMLLHHHLAESAQPAGAPGFRDQFVQTMNTFGFPQASCLRKVSLVNGSKNGYLQGSSPCADALNIWTKISKISIGEKLVDGYVKLAPDANASCLVSTVKFSTSGWPRFLAFRYIQNYYATGSTDISKLDQLPGGYFRVFDQIADQSRNNDFFGYTQANVFFQNMSFIPTVSSLALYTKERNWSDNLSYISRQNGNVSALTPFDDVYMPDANEDHTSLTAASVQFVLDQIAEANRQQCATPPPPPTPCTLPANACYTIQVQQTGQRVQAMADGTIQQQGANNQTNQIWKLEDRGNSRVSFATQDGTNRVVKVDNGTGYDEWLSLGSYTDDDRQKWSLECNPGNNALWRVSRNGITWDVKDFGNSPQLQLWGSTSESFFNYRSFQFAGVTCPTGTPPPPPPGTLAFSTIGYDCTSGIWQFQFTGGNGNSIEAWSPGAFGNRIISANSVQSVTLDGHLRTGTNFTVSAVQLGITYTFSFASSCGGTPPPPPPPPPGVLGIIAPTYNCTSGDLTINTTGGNGNPIEYQISGIRGWGSNPTMNVPSWQRNNNTSFTLQARQSGTEAPSRTFTASCGGGRLASVIEETVRLSVSPNPTRGVVRVRYWLAARQAGQLRVVSAKGAVLSEQTVVGTGQTEETTLNLDAHPAGLYLINLSSGPIHETAKVLLQR